LRNSLSAYHKGPSCYSIGNGAWRRMIYSTQTIQD